MSVLLHTTHRPRRKPLLRPIPAQGAHVFLTGTFYSPNWINSQLIPLARAREVGRVTFVSATPVQDIDGITVIYPPVILQKVLGAIPARLLTFAWHGVRMRPDFVGGFHLLINGLVAQLVARLARTRSVYICVGGPTEVLGGGYATENRIFGKLRGPDEKIERQLLQSINSFDAMIVRGQSAKEFYAQQNVSTPLYVVTAGVDSDLFSPNSKTPEFDIVFLARLSEVKRIEIFLSIVKILKNGYDDKIKALVIGDGPTRLSAEDYVARNELTGNVCFLGQVDDVAVHLTNSKVFVLTSRSEGLSQAMIQAMLCGLPPVVARVGSLADLIPDDTAGFLVDDHGNAESYVQPIISLLSDPDRLREAGAAARRSAMRCSIDSVAASWDEFIGRSGT